MDSQGINNNSILLKIHRKGSRFFVADACSDKKPGVIVEVEDKTFTKWRQAETWYEHVQREMRAAYEHGKQNRRQFRGRIAASRPEHAE